MDNKVGEEKADPAQPEHHESLIERVGDELEARFLAAAEVATATTSAETNLADAVIRAIEGPPKSKTDPDPKAP
ncbi:MAG TPA: hypothetical protein VGD57_00145 [Candidatus Dormibacteraeota bacterium]|jgi:hypothetical protein